MAVYLAKVWISGLPENLDETDLDTILYKNTKHANFSIDVEEILQEDDDD